MLTGGRAWARRTGQGQERGETTEWERGYNTSAYDVRRKRGDHASGGRDGRDNENGKRGKRERKGRKCRRSGGKGGGEGRGTSCV